MPDPALECPLCHGSAHNEPSYEGSYDLDVSHIVFIRKFGRCENYQCGAVFFEDYVTDRSGDENWEVELERAGENAEQRRKELLETPLYQSVLQARETNDPLVLKDRETMKQAKEIEGQLEQNDINLATFAEHMRNFAWVDTDGITEWVTSNWLPPNFAEKNLKIDSGMSRPAIRRDIPEEDRSLWQSPEPDTFEAGQKVIHPAWGEGVIVEGNAEGETLVTIEFPEQGVRKLDIRFAKLKAPRA